MLSFLSPDSLARRSARHPWLTLGFWAVLIAAALFSASSIKFNESQDIIGSDSYKADRLLDELRPEPPTETVVVQSLGANVDDVAYKSYVARLTGDIRALDGVAAATNYYETSDAGMVSKDRTKTVIAVELKGDMQDAPDKVGPLLHLLEERNKGEGFVALTAGDGSVNKELNEVAEKDLFRGESIGLPAALIILLLVFGAGVAAGVPVVLGLLGILVSVGVTAVFSRFFGVSSVVVNMITMIGLAVGIDYTLFIVERFREERARGKDKIDAIAEAGNTASRAVLFSGITVVIALAGLMIVPATVFRGLSLGAITVVLAAVAVALTLLPAVLSLLGDKINWLHLPGRGAAKPDQHESDSGFFGRTTALVIKHPLASATVAIVALLAAAAPVATIKLGSPGISDMPDNVQSVQAFKVIDKEFSAGRLSPAEVVIDGDVNSPAVRQAVENLRARVAQDKDFAQTTDLTVNADGTIGAFGVIANGDPTSTEARKNVERLRNEYIPAAFDGTSAKVYVTGDSASTTDYVETMTRYLPIVIAFVLTLSFLLLMMVFRSIVIPVKAIVMNLLSVGAAYGLIVLVFQHGVGADLLGFHQSDSVSAYLPVFLFAVLFGLSMDYHVFLLSRIQERFHQTHDNSGSVAFGLRSTAHIITGAAAIMMAVFGGFALGDMVDLQQMGFGLGVAVFLDATIVRSILVPASMEMLGERNWYLPSWLAWLPKINVEGGEQPAPARVPAYVPAGEAAFAAGGGGD